MGLTGKSRQRQLLCGPRAACLRRFVAQTVLGEFGIALAFALLGRTFGAIHGGSLLPLSPAEYRFLFAMLPPF
jgi:hypothetical protein